MIDPALRNGRVPKVFRWLSAPASTKNMTAEVKTRLASYGRRLITTDIVTATSPPQPALTTPACRTSISLGQGLRILKTNARARRGGDPLIHRLAVLQATYTHGHGATPRQSARNPRRRFLLNLNFTSVQTSGRIRPAAPHFPRQFSTPMRSRQLGFFRSAPPT